MLSFYQSYYKIFFGLCLILSCNSTQFLSDADLEQQAITERDSGEWLKAAQLFENLYQRNPSNESANYEAGTNYLKANYPQKGLDILNSYTTSSQKKDKQFDGRLARIAKANYKTGQYREVMTIVENYHYPKMYRGLAREHLKSLIQLKDNPAVGKYLLHYRQSGIYDDKGKRTPTGFLYQAICNELMIVDDEYLLPIYADAYHKWANIYKNEEQKHWAFAAFYKTNYEEAITRFKEAIANENSSRHLLEMEGMLGICYAKKGDTENVKIQLDKINTFPNLPPRHDAFGAKFYQHARIETALGQNEAAIQSLEKALANNAEFWSNKFKEDGLLVALFGQPKFEEMVKTK